jgi:type I restriction enzyme S subunit
MTFEHTTLGEQSTFLNNLRKPVTRSDRERGIYPYYGAAGIQDYVAEYLFDGKYILVGEDGTVLSNIEYPVVQQVAGKFWVNNHAHVIRPLDMADFDFLYYSLVGTRVINLVTGAVQPKLSMTNLKSLEILWPKDPKTRRTIGHTLNMLDEKIQANKQLSKTLEEIAQTIFKSWFIDFDPVKAKMAGEKPVGMDAATAALFPDSMEDSELGLIPKGWLANSLSEILVISKLSVNPQNYQATTFLHYSIPAFDDGAYPIKALGSEILSNKFLLNSSSVLVSKLNPQTTRIWTVLEPLNSAVCSTEFIVLVPKSESHLPFVDSTVREPSFLDVFVSMATGSTGSRQRVRPEDILQIDIAIPTQELIVKFSEIQMPILKKIQTLKEEIEVLAQLRDSLLPRLISGELQIPEEMLAS